MRVRRRAKGAPQLGKPSVLSTPPAGPLAPDSTEALQPRRRRRKSGTGVPKRTPPGGHPLTGDVLNAFWQKTDLILVVPDPTTSNGVRYRRLPAEHSCFIKRADLDEPDNFVRMLNHSSAVRKAVWEPDGEWLRVAWQNRDALKYYCKALHSDTHADTGAPKEPIPTFEGMVSPVLRHMVDNGLRPATPRMVWVDLETDSDVPFSRAIEGESRILCWATEDATGNRVHAMLEEDTDACERDLLVKLWSVLEHYDQVLAWGGDRFDFPIIKARSQRHDLLRSSEREWRRWLWLDHLELYRRMNMAAAESGDEKTSMALNAVAVSLKVGEKDRFDSSKTREAYETAPCDTGECLACCVCLMKYNIQDTALMPLIEDKTGYVMLLQTVCDTCGTFPDSRGSKPGVQVEAFLAALAHQRGHKFPTVLRVTGGETYEGAYVMHPEKEAGVHRNVHVADFAAQYPTIIRTWNISPETILPELDPDDDIPFAHSPLTKCNFRTDVPGILPEAVKQLMELRAVWNTRKAAATPGTAAWKDADRRSAAYKITANSFYGVIGDSSSRHYDRRVAESITQNAKWEILETIKAAEERGMKVIYADTDSLFVLGSTRKEFEAFVQWCNDELYPRITRMVGCVENHIKLAYEKAFDRLIFTTAKRYVGNYLHYKGTDADETSKPEIKGLEFKRGDSLRLTRRFQEQIAHMLVGYRCSAGHDPDAPELYEEVCAAWLNRIMEERLEADDISVSQKLGKPLDDYKVAIPMVRIARAMEARGEDVGEGARITYVILDAAASPQEVQEVQDYDPANTDMDRMALWDKQIWPATERLLQAAFPGHEWTRFSGLIKARKAAARAVIRESKRIEKQQEREAKKAIKLAAKRAKDTEKNPPPTRRMRRHAKTTA